MNATVCDVQRQVTLTKCDGFDDAVEARARHSEVMKAIGYLSQWAMHKDSTRVVKAAVGLLANGDMHALYRDAEGAIVYEIGAILREGGEYSFHS